MDKKMQNEEFEELDFAEQCKIVYETPPARKGDLIVRSHEPERLVNSLSPEELYLMVREMNSTNVPEIIQLANFSQLQFCADFECWNHDLISEHGFIRWLEYLETAGEEKFTLWLIHTDFTVLVAGFQKYATVLKPYHEETIDEVVADKPYFTLDNVYYILIEEENLKTIRGAFEVLFERAKHLYVNLVEAIMTDVEAIVEEEAFHLRQVRLSERGFPEREQAYRIYRRIERNEWDRYAERPRDEQATVSSNEVLSLYPVLWQAERLFFDDVMASLNEAPAEVQRTIYQELVWLCNKIITCDDINRFGETMVKKAFTHARYILNIGLEDVSNGDLMAARSILRSSWIEYIFRWGHSRLLEIRDVGERIVKAYWDYSFERLCDFLDPPFGPFLRGVMQTCPLYFDETVKDDFYQLRDFRSMDEVRTAAEYMTTIEHTFKLLSSRLCIGWTRYMDTRRVTVQLDQADITLSTIILTLFAHFILNDKISLKPLTTAELKRFITTAFLGTHGSGEPRTLNPDLTARFVAYVFDHGKIFSQHEFTCVRKMFTAVFKRAEEELGLLDLHGRLEARFIQCLLLHPLKNN